MNESDLLNLWLAQSMWRRLRWRLARRIAPFRIAPDVWVRDETRRAA